MALDPNINRIKFLRSTTAGAVPAASLLQDGELAINLVDRTIYSKNGANVVELGFGKGGSVKGNVAVTGTISASSTISAPTFSGALSGNASTASKWQTARSITFLGPYTTGALTIDGSANVSVTLDTKRISSTTYQINAATAPNAALGGGAGLEVDFVRPDEGWPSLGTVITAKGNAGGGGTLQLYTPYNDSYGGTGLRYRTGLYASSPLSWSDFKTLVDNNNIGDYAPTKTGGGASGTWGISISGNAATATKLQTARSINGVNFDGTANITVADSTKLPLTGGTLTGILTINATNGGVELGKSGSTNTPFIDFHSGPNNVDYDSRIIANGGTSTVGAGALQYVASAGHTFIGTVNASVSGTLSGNASTATALQTARTINGTSFNGTANITTANWGTARTLTVGNTGKSVNGAGNVSWSLAEIGALPLTGGSLSGKLTIKAPTYSPTLKDIGIGDNASIKTLPVQVPSNSTGYIPFIHGSASTTGSGYVTNVSIGAYRGANDWSNSGAYIAVGGNDAYPTEALVYKYGAILESTAGAITLKGNSTTATTLQNARTINGVSFNGSTNIAIEAESPYRGQITTVAQVDTSLTEGLYQVSDAAIAGLYNYGVLRVYKIGSTVNQIYYAHNSSSLGSIAIRQSWGSFSPWRIVDAPAPSNAATATALQTARTINGTSFNGTANITTANWGTARTFTYTGDVFGTLVTNGSANVLSTLTLADIATAGTYKSVTVDAKGRVTNGKTVITSLITSTSASGTSNVATTNSNTYLNIIENVGGSLSSVGSSSQVTGAGTVTVTSDTSGKITITGSNAISGNAGSATKLQTARTINGTSFNGSANITTANWGTARTISIGGTAKSVNGAANVTWTAQEIGLQYLGTAATKAISYNSQTIAENITVPGNVNALSAGPITINNGYTVTISDGATWSIV